MLHRMMLPGGDTDGPKRDGGQGRPSKTLTGHLFYP